MESCTGAAGGLAATVDREVWPLIATLKATVSSVIQITKSTNTLRLRMSVLKFGGCPLVAQDRFDDVRGLFGGARKYGRAPPDLLPPSTAPR